MENKADSKGITYLIDLLNKGNSPTERIRDWEFVAALRGGVQTEPEKLSKLVEAFQARIQRAYPDWTPEKARQRALGNMAAYALWADHDFDNEGTLRAMTGGPQTPEDWYDNTKEYGKAMNAFTEYIGAKGRSLRKLLKDFRK